MLGAEGDGLSRRALAAADTVVTIPMAGGVDSLNVAAASAVALWALRLAEPARRLDRLAAARRRVAPRRERRDRQRIGALRRDGVARRLVAHAPQHPRHEVLARPDEVDGARLAPGAAWEADRAASAAGRSAR